MNIFTGDCLVKKDIVYLSNSIVCTLSFKTGSTQLDNNKTRDRYTFIKSIFLGTEDEIEQAKAILSEGNLLTVTGHIDSEQYTTLSGKTVFNKILVLDDIKLLEM